MSATLGSRFTRRAVQKISTAQVRFPLLIPSPALTSFAVSTLLPRPTLPLTFPLLFSSSPLSGQRRPFATHVGPWPGPNPLKDIFIGLSIGLLFGVVFKSWQIKDKAERVRYYNEYDRANRVAEAMESKRKAAQPKEEEAEEDMETEHEDEAAA